MISRKQNVGPLITHYIRFIAGTFVFIFFNLRYSHSPTKGDFSDKLATAQTNVEGWIRIQSLSALISLDGCPFLIKNRPMSYAQVGI